MMLSTKKLDIRTQRKHILKIFFFQEKITVILLDYCAKIDLPTYLCKIVKYKTEIWQKWERKVSGLIKFILLRFKVALNNVY